MRPTQGSYFPPHSHTHGTVPPGDSSMPVRLGYSRHKVCSSFHPAAVLLPIPVVFILFETSFITGLQGKRMICSHTISFDLYNSTVAEDKILVQPHQLMKGNNLARLPSFPCRAFRRHTLVALLAKLPHCLTAPNHDAGFVFCFPFPP